MPFDGGGVNPVAALLIAGRDRIAKKWIQGAYCDEEGGVCVMGAVGYTDENQRLVLPFEARWQAQEQLSAASHANRGRAESIWEWNDEPGRTQEEILALFDRAIEMSFR